MPKPLFCSPVFQYNPCTTFYIHDDTFTEGNSMSIFVNITSFFDIVCHVLPNDVTFGNGNWILFTQWTL